MEFITDWITQLVVFVFIATIITLLIPKTSHEQVIRIVFGMIILLLFLHPLTTLFQVNPEEVVDNFEFSSDLINVDTFEEKIESQKKEIQASSDAYILEQLTQELQNSVEEELMEEYDLAIQDVLMKWKEDRETEEISEMVDHVTFVVTEQQTGVEQVEEVEIPADQDKETMDDDMIKQTIASYLNLPLSKISIEWEGGR
ncbi:stage III sporulation protein AF [Alkalibacillus salilacus]|uniref:Stage III sporulation protein AF n=1 Tax=Alkalibacillus salilacus TaxID=284582 RepID=A0ABT9VC97_9BACI|nr:stage III sporulation protein AF [Alkalibacillus salilacus]MDQ0158593.1 stage III sporulation protein AF [Alkalibacillus salilacus]